jgi:hypothetical protein
VSALALTAVQPLSSKETERSFRVSSGSREKGTVFLERLLMLHLPMMKN